jgi:hypothetical protein
VKFPIGNVLATPEALQALVSAGENPADFVLRHTRGDWGEVDQYDKNENELAVRHGFRLLSAYRLSTGKKIWIITEADRSCTTILLPEEY